MATENEIEAAFKAAADVLKAADFEMDEKGMAWCEPGDEQVMGFDLRTVVTAALEAAQRQRGV